MHRLQHVYSTTALTTTCLQYKGIQLDTKHFNYQQISTIIRSILTGFTQPKGSWNNEGGPLQTMHPLVWISTNLSSTFGCSSCFMGFQNSASGFWIIWIIGPLGIARDCRPGSIHHCARSHSHHIHTSNKYMPAYNEWTFHPTHPTMERAPVIDIVGFRCLYICFCRCNQCVK